MDWRELSRSELLEKAARDPRVQFDPELQELLRVANRETEANPLLVFEPHPEREGRRPQLEFIEARTRIVAAFAGNQFGKSTILTACGLREALPSSCLPSLLARTRRYEPPTDGWIVCPSEDKIYDVFQPTFEEWCPKAEFKGGSWGKAYNGARMLLSFKNGSTITFKTYKQDPSTLGGARLHWVGYDEPPPRRHREECRMRLSRYGGHEMFALTPLEANTAYVRRVIYKQRGHPDITVVRGSIHDNPTLDKATVEATLGDYSDLWRRAREFGDFVDVGGLIYPEFERCVLPEAPTSKYVRTLDHVVSVDPGIRNAGIVFEGFDSENVCLIFDEVLLQDSTPKQYAEAIRAKLQRWGIPFDRVHFVIDPAARSRGQTNAETVMTALEREGIYCMAGQNDVQAGLGQGRIRMAHGRLKVSPDCRFLRDEADEYAAKEPAEDRDDSHLEPVKSNDHLLDAARYGWMERFWDPGVEDDALNRNLGWDPASQTVPPASLLLSGAQHRDYGPLGSAA